MRRGWRDPIVPIWIGVTTVVIAIALWSAVRSGFVETWLMGLVVAGFIAVISASLAFDVWLLNEGYSWLRRAMWRRARRGL